MTTRAEIIAEARSWRGTPWRHQGRLKGAAADCAGMVLKTGEACGLIAPEYANRTDYGRDPNPIKMKAALDLLLDRVPKQDRKPGDVLWFRVAEHAQHIGILTERGTVVHSINFRNFEELPLEERALNRIVAVYRFRGIAE